MYLIEILLPLYDNNGRSIDRSAFAEMRRELLEEFGGVTAHAEAPAQGLWEDPSGDVRRDDVVVFEVMTERADPDWWKAWRKRMERVFRQEEIVVRATRIERL